MSTPSQFSRRTCFGEFELDLDTAELRSNGSKVILPGQPFQVLLTLFDQPGQLVTREELKKRLWPPDTFVDFDQSLNKAVKRLRELLNDPANHPRFVETLPRRGYRWIGPLPTNNNKYTIVETVVPALQIDGPQSPACDGEVNGGTQVAKAIGWRAVVGLSLIIVTFGFGGFLLFTRRQVLTEKDTVLLAEFENHTGNAIFDETLKQALAIELTQSPFLNILPQDGVQETLQYMGHSPNERITAVVAREICERRGIRAILRGSISNLGRKYVIALEARNCLTGGALAQQEEVVDSPEQALRGLEKAATRLRGQLGESLSSIQKFAVPLERATTSSLEALQAYSFANQKLAEGGDLWDAIPFLLKATELDPNFAMAYATLGEIYSAGGPTSHDELAKSSLARAFALRDKVSEREKLYIVSTYYENATRELDKAADAYELWKWTYPQDVEPLDGLAGIYNATGKYEKAAENAQSALLLRPKRAISYERLAGIYTYLNRLDDAKGFCDQASAKKIDGPRIHWKLYVIAYLKNDFPAMQKELEWARGQGETTRVLFYQALVAGGNGQLRRSEELFRATMDDRLADHDEEGAALAAVQLALIEGHFGYSMKARRRAADSLKLLSANTDLASVALAVAGDDVAAKKPLEFVIGTFPQDTLLKNVIAPVVAAQAALNHGRPKEAIDLLRSAQPYELGADNAGRGFMAIYIRGQAYLQMHAGTYAATEFQKIIDHRGVDPFSPLHVLAYLGRARAYALDDDHARTRPAYEEFFVRWKDADVDLPILAKARAEYAKLE